MNLNFRYFVPTQICSGRNCVEENASLLSALGTRALVVTGRHSAKACGALDDVLNALESCGRAWTLFDDIDPNPSVASVYEGARRAREFGADFVVAVGGGSPMDAAKAIALLARQEIPEEKLFSGGFSSDVLPMAHVPTTAGTGSEVTQYAVLTNDREQTKKSISGDMLFPNLALLDGKYLKTLSRASAVNTAVDAVSHAAEGMLSVRAGALSDLLARESLTLLGARLDRVAAGNCSEEDFDTLLYASCLAGMVIANTGTTAVHAMGYPLTYFEGIDHGRANGLLLGEFLKWAEKGDSRLTKKILQPLGFSLADEFTEKLRELFGGRERLSESKICAFSSKSAQNKNVRNCKLVASEREIAEIYRKSFDFDAE